MIEQASHKRPSEILLVDDDATSREGLYRLLDHEGYHVSAVADGMEACARVSRCLFDIVLMDIQMRRMNGWEALARIHILRPALPIIIVSAYATPSVRERAFEAGASRIMRKPVRYESLRNVFEEVFGSTE